MATAFADGLDMKCQRKKRIKDDCRATGKNAIAINERHKKSMGREGSLQEEENTAIACIKFEMTRHPSEDVSLSAGYSSLEFTRKTQARNKFGNCVWMILVF